MQHTQRMPRPQHDAAATAHRSGKSLTGQILGNYLLTGKLGTGGEGTVYRALHKDIGKERAIKILNADAAQATYERIRFEAQLLGRIEHPNIVHVYDFNDDGFAPYIVMELVDGFNLGELLRQIGRLDALRAINIIMQIADGLRVLAREGIVHRDIKPANILLTKNGTPKLSDLGSGLLAEAPGTQRTGTDGGHIVGTAFYMAPEQIETPTQIDHRADIYALGATFYHMLTGVPPCDGPNVRTVLYNKALAARQGQTAFVPPHERVPNLPVESSAVIAKMLAPTPAQRNTDYDELLADLQQLYAICEPPPARTPRESGTDTALLRDSVREAASTTTHSNAQDNIGTMLRLATALVSCNKRGEARQLMLPWKGRAYQTEAYWLLLARTASTTKEAADTAEEALQSLPTSERLQALRQQLANQAMVMRKCAFCSTPLVAESHLCGHCGGRTTLAEPGIWQTHQPKNPTLIRQAIATYTKLAQTQPDLRWSLALAFAYLNLRDFAAAHQHLDAVAQRRPDYPGLTAQLQHVQQWLHTTAPRRGRIAVIDDSPTVRRMVEAKLREFDYEVTCFPNGDAALEHLPSLQPDVVLLDVNMPGRDGYQICSWIRGHGTLKKTPVVMLTGDDGFFDKIRGKLAGASRYIGKPFATENLIQVVDQYVAGRKK